ncbi:MAG: PBSX family phage terminase large subunit [Gammaproteobacteria bacterium]|nr:PBSX family phage terminase large subunit [Gammaproteobacteria bacterium]
MSDKVVEVDADFPAKLKPIFEPARYKVMHGGRGGGKSWAVARALLILATQKPLRILCAREVQKSIKESVHSLLSDQLGALQLGGFYRVLDTEIRGSNGSRFIFAGLASHTTESIKSYEGVDICWIEEAQSVSKRSFDILTPTIRKPESEIWLTMNPHMLSGEAYQRFVISPPTGAWVCQINYSDNPWFPAVLDVERMDCRRTRPKEEYENIWEGEPLRTAEGAYYASQITAIRSQGRIREVPYQAGIPVNTFWDLGYNDTTAIWFHQRVTMEDRFILAYEDSGESLEHYARYLQERGFAYDTHYLPHDAENKSLQTGRSVLEILESLLPGHRFEVVPRVENVLSGIQDTRLKLSGAVYFDAVNCHAGIEALERYRKEWDEKLQVFKDRPLHDAASNYSDAIRQWGQGYMPSAMTKSRNKSGRRSWRSS